MASNSSPAAGPRRSGRRPSGQNPIRAAQKPTPVQTPMQEEQHTTYQKVLTRNAICDVCEKKNTTCMQKCTKCGLTACLPCHLNGKYDSRHALCLYDLDWSYEPRGRQRGKRSGDVHDSQARPTSKRSRQDGVTRQRGLVRESTRLREVVVTLDPALRADADTRLGQSSNQDLDMPMEMETQLPHRNHLSFYRESPIQNELLPTQPTGSSVGRATTPVRDNPIAGEDIYDASPKRSTNTAPAKSSMSENSRNTREPVAKFVYTISTKSSNDKEEEKVNDPMDLDRNNEPSTGSSARAIKWNEEAFPGADETMITKILIQGGQETMKLARKIGNLAQADAQLSGYIKCAKLCLTQCDPWATAHPEDFECQWSFVEELIDKWHHDELIQREKIEAGELCALKMLEGARNLLDIYKNTPQASFWVFWVEGMRQALEEHN
ncbi:hypothetical protein HD806DRAFT_549014 [Xylariaceae sp. AK1471]|nr:hypothetical protein HD806DRAFT_549014 [Xylariaceae sp. AK1471]